ncbi:MAG: succinate dehydrogenase assembly factor 2 [Gammaproteobacteria bacterium]|jgi:antitoxin CptB|nr:succinate dehydrogenase assembly factor 2 [Gammaproteobacteria bacterium]MDH3752007.1 succinate dehydrogenase assembly factor 2 [Gammaproteobacteria bacterium]MDH3806239.1 succinate dehydrogenase assembly factor 2 [Gammaproteobacteria bacterium]
MRELDELLLAYLEHRYTDAPAADKKAFCSLLQLSDPELMGYLLQREQPAAELARVIAHILDRTQT